ncbi:DUF5518 domain-containing protein [Halobacterium yunchengense]|uniref:DUF5518 domain-containing protein n=1 Tax=Halobacterium yunchengense TaxID=3108497 RepID=UPI00300A6EF6
MDEADTAEGPVEDAPGGTVDDRSRSRYPLPAFVDWLAAAVVAVAGLATVLGGVVLTFLVDRDAVAAGVESGELQVVFFERELADPEAVEFTLAVASWSGLGLLVTGVALCLFAVGYLAVRQRAHSSAEGGRAPGTLRSHAVVGAVTAAVLSFLPVSPAVGGGVAGYLEAHESARATSAGALSGLLLVLPVVVELAFLGVGLFAGAAAVDASDVGVVASVVVAFAVVVVAVVSVGLGAVGGFVGGRLFER